MKDHSVRASPAQSCALMVAVALTCTCELATRSARDLGEPNCLSSAELARDVGGSCKVLVDYQDRVARELPLRSPVVYRAESGADAALSIIAWSDTGHDLWADLILAVWSDGLVVWRSQLVSDRSPPIYHAVRVQTQELQRYIAASARVVDACPNGVPYGAPNGFHGAQAAIVRTTESGQVVRLASTMDVVLTELTAFGSIPEVVAFRSSVAELRSTLWPYVVQSHDVDGVIELRIGR